jgi:hypothetical protein
MARRRADEMKMEIDLPDELIQDLKKVAEALGLGPPKEAAVIGIADWIARRKAELDDFDPSQRYFINEALDEIIGEKK